MVDLGWSFFGGVVVFGEWWFLEGGGFWRVVVFEEVLVFGGWWFLEGGGFWRVVVSGFFVFFLSI